MALVSRRPSWSRSTPAGTQGQGQKPVLYVVATSHLDSQWNWTVQDSIRRFVPATFFENFDRFESFPDYVFSYEGAIHYMWFKEYSRRLAAPAAVRRQRTMAHCRQLDQCRRRQRAVARIADASRALREAVLPQ